MKNKHTATIVGILMFSTSTVMAGHRDRVDGDVYFEEARVIRVDPIYTTVRVEIPQEECYQQEVRSPVYNNHSNGTALVGGVIG